MWENGSRSEGLIQILERAPLECAERKNVISEGTGRNSVVSEILAMFCFLSWKVCMSAHFIFITLLKIHICNPFVCLFIEIKIMFKGEELLYKGWVLASRHRNVLERGQDARGLPEVGVWGGPTHGASEEPFTKPVLLPHCRRALPLKSRPLSPKPRLPLS